MGAKNRYVQLIEAVFFASYRPGMTKVEFRRTDLERHARKLKIPLPKNLGDIIYSFRYRSDFPKRIREAAPPGKEWTILPAGRGQYVFVAETLTDLGPNPSLLQIKVPDATPGIITLYALTDEQSLLAKIRYNRLLDLFTRLVCYSLQSHLRTAVPDLGQLETDEVYIGVDREGGHYVIPVQAKGPRDRLGVVQVQQDMAMCARKFPALTCRSVGAQFLAEDVIALLEFCATPEGLRIAAERHYYLVPPDKFTDEDLQRYRSLAQSTDG
ncbi:MAG: endonuclease [Candidatus Hydrogenedentes bacterium]|nr:endonuclease [Candidatus Hydrogenedentota bacterium]